MIKTIFVPHCFSTKKLPAHCNIKSLPLEGKVLSDSETDEVYNGAQGGALSPALCPNPTHSLRSHAGTQRQTRVLSRKSGEKILFQKAFVQAVDFSLETVFLFYTKPRKKSINSLLNRTPRASKPHFPRKTAKTTWFCTKSHPVFPCFDVQYFVDLLLFEWYTEYVRQILWKENTTWKD